MTEKRSEIKLPLILSKNHRYSRKMIKKLYLPSKLPMKVVRAHGNIALHWRSSRFSMASIIFAFGSEMSKLNFNVIGSMHVEQKAIFMILLNINLKTTLEILSSSFLFDELNLF